MPLIPLSLQHDLENFFRMPTHHFGLGMNPLDFYRPYGLAPALTQSGDCKSCGKRGALTKVEEPEEFKVNINVKEFAPEELKITSEGNVIVIEGKHEEKVDGDGVVWRHFVRKYLVPEGYHLEGAVSNLSKNGILTITAPKKGDLKPESVPIAITHSSQEKNSKAKN